MHVPMTTSTGTRVPGRLPHGRAGVLGRLGGLACLARLDDGSYFGRLPDRQRGGWCAITRPTRRCAAAAATLDGTLVLASPRRAESGGLTAQSPTISPRSRRGSGAGRGPRQDHR
jgi:hypothetical protein